MISLGRWKASEYINCLSKYYQRPLVDSMAFLLCSRDGLELYYFKPIQKGVIAYIDELEDIQDECNKEYELFKNYDASIVMSTAYKLWFYYAGKIKKNDFTSKERELLKQLKVNM